MGRGGDAAPAGAGSAAPRVWTIGEVRERAAKGEWLKQQAETLEKSGGAAGWKQHCGGHGRGRHGGGGGGWRGVWKARFIADVGLQDGERVSPGAALTKTWRSVDGAEYRLDWVTVPQAFIGRCREARRFDEVDLSMGRQDHWGVGLTLILAANSTPAGVARRQLRYNRRLLRDPDRVLAFNRCGAGPSGPGGGPHSGVAEDLLPDGGEGAEDVATDRAAHAPVVHHDHLLRRAQLRILVEEVRVDRHRAKLVLDDGKLLRALPLVRRSSRYGRCMSWLHGLVSCSPWGAIPHSGNSCDHCR